MLDQCEVQVGLALRLDPERMLERGARVTCDARYRADGPHHFICVGRHGDTSDWVATSSRWARERVLISRKWGHSSWTGPATWADPYQVWTIDFATLRAAAAGTDWSFSGGRNFAAVDVADDLNPAA